MKIQVIGKNSSNRIKLLKNINKVKKDQDLNVILEIIDNENYEKKYNISNTPALIINNKVVSQGKVLTDREIKNYVRLLA